jgi:hypothetical protein
MLVAEEAADMGTSVKISRASANRPCSARTAPIPFAAYTLPSEHTEDHQTRLLRAG